MSLCDNPLHGLASELAVRACDVVRSCVGGALTAIKEVVEVASEVRTTQRNRFGRMVWCGALTLFWDRILFA